MLMATEDKDNSRGLISYTSRDYKSVLQNFKDIIPVLTDLWYPEADADPGMVLLKLLASTADMLGINTDILANELYAPSMVQRKSAEKILGLIGYELGWYRAARTEITFYNASDHTIRLDFGFSGSTFATMNAYSDITGTSTVITYNILPMTNAYGVQESRSRRQLISENLDVFTPHDIVNLESQHSVTRVGIEGELRKTSISVTQVKQNNYIIPLASQNVDPSAVWLRAATTQTGETFRTEQWIQVVNTSEFTTPEPRFAVTYDTYSNARIQVSNYLNQLEDYENCWLFVYWIDTTGTLGCVSKDVLTNFVPAVSGDDVNLTDELENIAISNIANTSELPHTNVVTGQSPETAKEAYRDSRNYINTFDSLVTLPDYNRFLRREPGVDTGVVIDCQKALELNIAIYQDSALTKEEKSKMYISNQDFPEGDMSFFWPDMLDLEFDPADPMNFVFAPNFKTYTAMCFLISNDFQNSYWGQGQVAEAQIKNETRFKRYKPPVMFIENLIKDYAPLQAMSVKIEVGYARIFEWYIVGMIYPKKPVSEDVGKNIIKHAKEDLALYFAPANREFGKKPTLMEVVDVIMKSDDRISYFDAGSIKNPVINWYKCDPTYFNYISFARYLSEPEGGSDNLRIAPEYIVK